MTHRSFRFLRAVFGCVLTFAAVLAAPAHADTLDTIQKNSVVRIGVFMDYPPFGSIGPDMKPQGYDIDMGEYLARALKVKAEFVPITGENRMAYLATHKADLLLSVGQTPEREKVIDFSKPYAPYYLAVFGPKSLAVKSTADLAGKSVAVARGTLEDLSVTKAAPAGADIKRFEDPNGAISAFLTGQAQLLVVGNDVGATIIAKNPPVQPEQKFQLFSSPDHVGLNKQEPRLLKKVDAAIAQAKKDGTLNTLSTKWLKALYPADL
ncbi:ABC-type amino acid transport/signal transduction system, periplasmic component/domain [Candidatus Burkholderia verschuerenii]|uniref:ABC-type amino acid transport/signal transduction system, periplasmic component/domain n=1 Tax=Candidatus Burkholderia verschuerenii TaxID=242163 RepID=A0A0L0MFK0_9BURK|nr:transporter substrate-binding domain-containing protein [Candidatus Burkholderia verschuerenii]KND60749.1 ABC-type amino acid transport/signal transduction system, periplasmic component/domain [Candidatus Burkholderia verschuerenii]